MPWCHLSVVLRVGETKSRKCHADSREGCQSEDLTKRWLRLFSNSIFCQIFQVHNQFSKQSQQGVFRLDHIGGTQ